MSAERKLPLAVVCRLAGVSRSAASERRKGLREGPIHRPSRKRGPIGAMSDRDLRAEIHTTIEGSPFVGEGHRKIWARMRRRGIRTSRKRVLRLMREGRTGLTAPLA